MLQVIKLQKYSSKCNSTMYVFFLVLHGHLVALRVGLEEGWAVGRYSERMIIHGEERRAFRIEGGRAQ